MAPECHTAQAEIRAKQENRKTAAQLLDNATIRSILFKAVMQEDLELLDKLLDQGVNINVANAGGYTQLGLASERGKKLAFEWLIRHGARVIP